VRHRWFVTAAALVLLASVAALWLEEPGSPIHAGAGPAASPAPVASASEETAITAIADPIGPARTPQEPTVVLKASVEAEPQKASTISGRVIDDTGVPLEGAKVKASPRLEDTDELPEPEAVSDRDGRFTIEGCISVGTYMVGAELKGYWLQAHVERSAGANDVELILLRSGGLKGRVIEAYGSSVTDYIVVGKYEPPKGPDIEWTPERQANLERELKRLTMRRLQRQAEADFNEMLTRRLMEDILGREEQRPDGDAWAHLQPDGSFELVGLKPGKNSVIVAARDRKRGLVTVSGVDVLPVVVSRDPRLNPVDLNPHACVYEVTIRDAEGIPIAAGSLDALASEDNHTRFTVEFKDGRARFVGNMGLLSITATAEGYQPVTVYSPAQIITVTLLKESGN
jgi:hypothetical protein